MAPTLLRESTGAMGFVPSHPQYDGVYLSKKEHARLLALANRYINLRTKLVTLGADIETIERFSIEASDGIHDKEHDTVDFPLPALDEFSPENAHDSTSTRAFSGSSLVVGSQRPLGGRASSTDGLASSSPSSDGDYIGQHAECSDHDLPSSSTGIPEDHLDLDDTDSPDYVHRFAKRSLQLDNLAMGTSVADITSVLRGGQIVEIFMRRREKAAVVSFVHERDAQAFYERCRRRDLYIKFKRVDVRFAEQQFIIQGHMARRIRNGATRNLIIRQCDPYQDAEGIRDDLEHIHNLVVASVEFRGRDCHIKTNSISGAFFARTCMSSRHRYRKCRIDWGEDECMEPFAAEPARQVKASKEPLRKVERPVNRYEMLEVE